MPAIFLGIKHKALLPSIPPLRGAGASLAAPDWLEAKMGQRREDKKPQTTTVYLFMILLLLQLALNSSPSPFFPLAPENKEFLLDAQWHHRQKMSWTILAASILSAGLVVTQHLWMDPHKG